MNRPRADRVKNAMDQIKDDTDLLNAELARLDARGEIRAFRELSGGPGLVWVARDAAGGGEPERALIAHPAATLAALRALPAGAGAQDAWDAL